MHNALEHQPLSSVSTHEDARDGAGTYVFMDSNCVRTHIGCLLGSVTARLCVVRSVMVLI